MNLEQAVPLFLVSDMERSLRFYVDGLGFEMKNKWTPEGDRIRWCWLQAGGAAVMLQESQKPLEGKPGLGVSIWFQCGDSIAIYHQLSPRIESDLNGRFCERLIPQSMPSC